MTNNFYPDTRLKYTNHQAEAYRYQNKILSLDNRSHIAD